MTIKVEIVGAKQVINGFKQVKKSIEKKITRRLIKAGRLVERDAKRFCPVDTGTLRSSINTIPVGLFSVQVGTDVNYAEFVEFGTVKMQAQPYLRPAVDMNIQKIRNELGGMISEVITEVSG